MSIINPGDVPIQENVVDGTELARRIERFVAAFHSQNANPTRPASVTAGGLWSRTGQAGDPTLFIYDGATDHEVGGGGVTTGIAQPASPGTGDLFYNTATSTLQLYDGAAWKDVNGIQLASTFSAAATYTTGTIVFQAGKYYKAPAPIAAGAFVPANWTDITPNILNNLGIDLAADQTWTGSQRGAVVAANAGSFDMNASNNFSCTPAGAVTLDFTNIAAGQSGFIYLDNTGNFTVSKTAAVLSGAQLLPTVSLTGKYLLSYFAPNATTVVVSFAGALS